jgi:hypothetical protein
MNDQKTSTTSDHQHRSSHENNVTASPSNTRVTITASSPTSTSFEDPLIYSGGPIPDSARKSYIQQKLPVRKQSLAAFGSNRRQKVPTRRVGSSILYPPPERLTRALTTGTPPSTLQSSTMYKAPTRSVTVASPSSPFSLDLSDSHTNSCTSNNVTDTSSPTSNMDSSNKLPIFYSSTTTTSSSMITAPTNINNSNGDGNDEDFDFGNRPPSTIDYTQPILPTTSSSSSLSSPNVSISVYMTPTLEPLNVSSEENPSYNNDDDPSLPTPSPISTQALDSTRDNDDDSTVFSPCTPAPHSDYATDQNSGSDWPVITLPLSEINNNEEEQERAYQKNGMIEGKILFLFGR